MIITKDITAMKHLVSKDSLRAVLTGIHWNPADKYFEATDTVMLARYYPDPNLEGMDTEDYPGDSFINGDKEIKDCIISSDIFDIVKQAKKHNSMPMIDQKVLVKQENDDRLNVMVNPIDTPIKAEVRLLQGMYPKTDAVFPKDVPFIRKYFNASKFENLIKFIKQIANPVTHVFAMDITEHGPVRFRVENSNNNTMSDGLIMPTEACTWEMAQPEYELKPYYIIEYTFKDGTTDTHIEFEDGDELNKCYNKNYAYMHAQSFKRKHEDSLNPVHSYQIKVVYDQQFIVDNWIAMPETSDEDSTDEHLTPEEEDAINELTDGPGSSDSEIVQIETCRAADESVRTDWLLEDSEKLEFLFKAGKTLEDLSEIFDRDIAYIENKLIALNLLDKKDVEPFINEEDIKDIEEVPDTKSFFREVGSDGYDSNNNIEIAVRGILLSSRFNPQYPVYETFKIKVQPITLTEARRPKLVELILANAKAHGIDTEGKLTVNTPNEEFYINAHVIELNKPLDDIYNDLAELDKLLN